MFSSNSNSSNNNKNKSRRTIHSNSPHDGEGLPCKQEDEDITADMIHSSIEQQQEEHERLLRIAEQSLRERNTEGDAVFLEMERMIMNEIQQEGEKKEDNNSTNEALATATTSTATIEDEDEELVVMTRTTREEQEDVGSKERRLLLAVDDKRTMY